MNYTDDLYHCVLDLNDEDVAVGVYGGDTPEDAIATCIDKVQQAYAGNPNIKEAGLSFTVIDAICCSSNIEQRITATPIREAINSAYESEDVDWAEVIKSDLNECYVRSLTPSADLKALIDEIDRFTRSLDVTIDPNAVLHAVFVNDGLVCTVATRPVGVQATVEACEANPAVKFVCAGREIVRWAVDRTDNSVWFYTGARA